MQNRRFLGDLITECNDAIVRQEPQPSTTMVVCNGVERAIYFLHLERAA
jgi:hypothetical protein